MRERVIWFILRAAVACVFWLLVLHGIWRQWFADLLKFEDDLAAKISRFPTEEILGDGGRALCQKG